MNRGRKSKLSLNHETLRVLSPTQLSQLGAAAAQSAEYESGVSTNTMGPTTTATVYTCLKGTCGCRPVAVM